MDRQTAARNVRNVINHVTHAAAAGRTIKADSTEAVGDYVYAPDVAGALRRLLLAPRGALHHGVYNVAGGVTSTVRDLVALAAAAVPGFKLEVDAAAAADLRTVPDRRSGKWAAYDIARAAEDLGWRPRPLAEAVRDYITWLRAEGNEGGRISQRSPDEEV